MQQPTAENEKKLYLLNERMEFDSLCPARCPKSIFRI